MYPHRGVYSMYRYYFLETNGPQMNGGVDYTPQVRVFHTDFDMGGDRSPPIGGGLQGGDKGPMGGD